MDTAGNPISEQFPLLRAASVSARTKDPLLTSVVATIPAGRLVAYNGSTVITADLAYSGGTYLADKKASLKVYTSTAGPTGPWTAAAYTFTDLGLGHYITTVKTTTKTWYQVRFVAGRTLRCVQQQRRRC